MADTTWESLGQTVIEGFRDLGAADPLSLTRKVLLRDGYIAGAVYECEGLRATASEDFRTVQFHAADGTPLRTVHLATESVRKAA